METELTHTHTHTHTHFSTRRGSPEEVRLAVESPVSRKTLLGQIAFALAARHALDVPGPVQNFEQEPVQDGLVAPRAVHHGDASPPQVETESLFICGV